MMTVMVTTMVVCLGVGGCDRSGENKEGNGSKDEVA